MQLVAKTLFVLVISSFAFAQEDPNYGCYEGDAVKSNIQPALQADLAKWQALGWKDYAYDFFFVKAGKKYCPVTIHVTNGQDITVSQEQTQLPNGDGCEHNPAEVVLIEKQLTMDVYLNELIGHSESAYYMCWQPQRDDEGRLFSYMYLSATADQDVYDDSEVYITNVRQPTPLPPSTPTPPAEAAEVTPSPPSPAPTAPTTTLAGPRAPTTAAAVAVAETGNNRRLGPVLRGAVRGAVRGCIAGAIIAGNCGGGARVGATVGAVSGALRPRPWGPPRSGGVVVVAGGRRGW